MNRLADQTSPYLLQHARNPVDWRPWGPEALEAARATNRPIFLSIGYAACHWCHVMERESFENASVAALLNERFIPIKVDREERPDLDEIYMGAVQLLTGQGGWPLSVFLTPDLEPFFGGTYFPPEDRWGRLGFPGVLRRVHEAWTARPRDVRESARALTAELRRGAEVASARGEGPLPGADLLARATAELAARFDPRWGGFGPAPKFPHEGGLALLLADHARSGEAVPLRIAHATLSHMAAGGIYDHVGGGFARYSVDERWLVPHFEKMLYNQALLVPLYADAWLRTGDAGHARVVRQTLDFVRRELTDPGGGLWSSLDADSEGHEGRYYVWTPDEIAAVLGVAEGERWCAAYGITPQGNFEGYGIPNRLDAGGGEDEVERLAPSTARVLAARAGRIRPATDDKILAAWNGLAISAFARAFQVFGRAEDLHSARRAAGFVLEHMRAGERLRVSWRAGRTQPHDYLDDYAFLAGGLIDLYEACFEPAWLLQAERLLEVLLARFADPAGAGFCFTPDDHETLPVRSRIHHDGALPSGAGMAAQALLRVAAHRDRGDLRRAAEGALAASRPAIARAPSAHAALLAAAALARAGAPSLAIAGAPADPRTAALLAVARRAHRGLAVQVAEPAAADPRLTLLAGRTMHGGEPTAYYCRDGACQAPVTRPAELERALHET